MKTDDLIQLIAADATAPRPNLSLRLVSGALAGAAVSVAILLTSYGMRPGLGDAMLTWRVALKFVAALVLAGTAAALALRLARPDAPGGNGWLTLAAAPLIVGVASIAELAANPSSAWPSLMTGRFPLACLISVPVLAALPLAGTLWALREAAPAVPAGLGLAAGATAAGLGAAVYALHCPDDSPLFLLVWYGLAAIAVIAAGGLSGARVLRW